MQRQREGNSAVSKLTWTDAGRPEGQKEKADEEEEGEETEKQSKFIINDTQPAACGEREG